MSTNLGPPPFSGPPIESDFAGAPLDRQLDRLPHLIGDRRIRVAGTVLGIAGREPVLRERPQGRLDGRHVIRRDDRATGLLGNPAGLGPGSQTQDRRARNQIFVELEVRELGAFGRGEDKQGVSRSLQRQRCGSLKATNCSTPDR